MKTCESCGFQFEVLSDDGVLCAGCAEDRLAEQLFQAEVEADRVMRWWPVAAPMVAAGAYGLIRIVGILIGRW